MTPGLLIFAVVIIFIISCAAVWLAYEIIQTNHTFKEQQRINKLTDELLQIRDSFTKEEYQKYAQILQDYRNTHGKLPEYPECLPIKIQAAYQVRRS